MGVYVQFDQFSMDKICQLPARILCISHSYIYELIRDASWKTRRYKLILLLRFLHDRAFLSSQLYYVLLCVTGMNCVFLSISMLSHIQKFLDCLSNLLVHCDFYIYFSYDEDNIMALQ